MDERVARTMCRLFEPVHAVTYFAPHCRAAADAIGMRGFWMGYFAMRAAPLGAVAPEVVTAAFYGFSPAMVARAIPDARRVASPAAALGARLAGVDAALRAIWGEELVQSRELAQAADLAQKAATTPIRRGAFSPPRTPPFPRPTSRTFGCGRPRPRCESTAATATWPRSWRCGSPRCSRTY